MAEFSSDNGVTWSELGGYVSVLAKKFTWKIPDIESDRCLVRLVANERWHILSQSDSTFTIGPDDVAIDATSPHRFTLAQNSPNPFNPSTSISFTIGHDSQVTLAVYNVAGEKVAELLKGDFSTGAHSVDWNASEFASGMYFYRIVAGDFVETRKMMLLR